MRYYKITISDPTSGQTTAEFASVLKDGSNDPGALNIELDLAVTGYARPMGPTQAFLRIWGPSVKQIGQQNNLIDKKIQIFGGMGKGLPLATQQAKYQGLLVTGTVQQAFANWIGTDMTLDMVLNDSTGSSDEPVNLSLNWMANTKLSDAIATTLQTAFPSYQQDIKISDMLVKNFDQPGVYYTLPQFVEWIKQKSKSINQDPNYPGVDIMIRDKTFFVYDGTSQTQPKQLQFNDLIGQPTWQNAPLIQITTVMRADLQVSDFITLPPGVISTTSAQNLGSRDTTSFQGTFWINQIRHVGNFRQLDGEAWVTVIDAGPVPPMG